MQHVIVRIWTIICLQMNVYILREKSPEAAPPPKNNAPSLPPQNMPQTKPNRQSSVHSLLLHVTNLPEQFRCDGLIVRARNGLGAK